MAVGHVKCGAYHLCILTFIYLTLSSQKLWFYSVKSRCCESQHFYVGSMISRPEFCGSITNRSSHSRYSARNKETILLGNFNVNYLTHTRFDKHFLIESLRSHNFKEITRPLSKSCLDHVWCTHPEHLNNATVLSSGISDHLPIVVTRK